MAFIPLAAVTRVLNSRADVELAYVFGSTSRGERRVDSDLDIAILFKEQLPPGDELQLRDELGAAAGVDVDLVVLNQASPLLAHEIISEGKVIVDSGEESQAAFEMRVLSMYLDTSHLRKVQFDYFRQRVKDREHAV